LMLVLVHRVCLVSFRGLIEKYSAKAGWGKKVFYSLYILHHELTSILLFMLSCCSEAHSSCQLFKEVVFLVTQSYVSDTWSINHHIKSSISNREGVFWRFRWFSHAIFSPWISLYCVTSLVSVHILWASQVSITFRLQP
jgi:hypothetical protein